MNGKTTGELTSRDADSIAQSNADDDGERVDRMQAQMGRRRFMAASAGAAAAVVATGGVAAAEGEVNFATDAVHAPRVEKDVAIAEHTEEMSSALEYVNDSGETVSLADDGAAIASRAADDEPHNPVTLRADRFATAEYRDFPRGETFTNADGDEEDLSALDAQHWTEDASGSAGSLTVETVEAANNEDALRVAASGQGAGDTVVAGFSDFSIDSGVARKYLQLVVGVDQLASGAVATVRLIDSAGQTIEAVVDSSADAGAVGTIATATGPAVVYQAQLGEFSTELDDVVELEVEISEADADLEIAALNLERESRWEYGSQEVLNSDDEIEETTVREPAGEFSITSFDGLPDVFASSRIHDLGVSVEFRAEELSEGDRRVRWGDAGPYDYPNRLETLVGYELPTAYDLSYSGGRAVDEVLYASSRYRDTDGVGFARLDELPTWSEVDDDEVSFTDRTSLYVDASIGDDVELTPSVSADEMLVVRHDVLLDDDDREAATAASTGGSAIGPTGSGGFWGTPLSIALTVMASITGYFALAKSKLPILNG